MYMCLCMSVFLGVSCVGAEVFLSGCQCVYVGVRLSAC